MTTIEEQIEDLQTLDQFKAKIIEVSQERDRYLEKLQELTKCLQQEQTSHGNTRRSLTNALADAVDLLAKAKAAKQQKSETTPNIQLKTEINHQQTDSIESMIFGAGCFWVVERKFWSLKGVVMTSVGCRWRSS